IWPPDDWPERSTIPNGAWAEAARVLTVPREASTDPWAGGWRLNASASARLEAEGLERSIELEPGSPAPPIAFALAGNVVHLDLAGRSTAFRLAAPPDVDRAAHAAVAHGSGASGPSRVAAPMPGAVVAIFVVPGQAVEIGDPIATLEAMKMEHVVTAPIDGRVADVAVGIADQVSRGQLVAVIEP
ncbi:MAG TPA: biotin/lipoyl-containing protein, partial [Candidatus Limnocylindrales bacterium]|nr:biotin/lipoyl-containing protein [Candidatus Limnocylindrales bacterium]